MVCASGSSRATNTSNMRWAGRSIRCEVTKPSDDIGNWSVVLSPFAGIMSALALASQQAKHPGPLSPKSFQSQTFLQRQRERGEKISAGKGRRPQVSWPMALRAVRAWLEPWIMLRRYWRAWSEQPPPLLLQCLLEQLGRGQQLFLYGTF